MPARIQDIKRLSFIHLNLDPLFSSPSGIPGLARYVQTCTLTEEPGEPSKMKPHPQQHVQHTIPRTSFQGQGSHNVKGRYSCTLLRPMMVLVLLTSPYSTPYEAQYNAPNHPFAAEWGIHVICDTHQTWFFAGEAARLEMLCYVTYLGMFMFRRGCVPFFPRRLKKKRIFLTRV